MRIRNETAYDTRTLLRLASAVHAWMAKDCGGRLRQWGRLRAEIVYSRGDWCSGYAYLGGSLTRWRLPNPAAARSGRRVPALVDGGVSTRYVAWLIWHELLHIYGHGHERMSPAAMQRTIGVELFAWVDARFGTTLPRAAVKVKPKPTLAERRAAQLARADLAIKRWTSKRKRAETALRKLQRRRRAIERAIEKAAAETALPIAASLPPA